MAQRVYLDDVVIANVVAARGDAMILVVMNLQLAPQYVGDPGGTGLTVVAEVEMLAIAGLVFDDAWLAVDDFPAVLAGQARCVAVAGHHDIGVGKAVIWSLHFDYAIGKRLKGCQHPIFQLDF